MEKEKYYTPSIEELHVGFEYEFETGTEGWKKFILKNDRIDATLRNLETFKTQFRVKYLDKEDIESFGFSKDDTLHFYLENMLFGGRNKVYKFDYKHLIYFIQNLDGLYEGTENKVIISVFNKETMEIKEHPVHLFNGKIKNKSELSRLLKQLSII